MHYSRIWTATVRVLIVGVNKGMYSRIRGQVCSSQCSNRRGEWRAVHEEAISGITPWKQIRINLRFGSFYKHKIVLLRSVVSVIEDLEAGSELRRRDSSPWFQCEILTNSVITYACLFRSNAAMQIDAGKRSWWKSNPPAAAKKRVGKCSYFCSAKWLFLANSNRQFLTSNFAFRLFGCKFHIF